MQLSNLVIYFNHIFAVIQGGGKVRVIYRYYVPADISRGSMGGITYEVKELADFKNLFTALKIPISTTNSSGNVTALKMRNAGELWLEHKDHLVFTNMTFNPPLLENRMSKQTYDKAADNFLNIYKGWKVTRYQAAKCHFQVYHRKLRPLMDEKMYVDIKPYCGWYHLEFVDKRNIANYPETSVGEIVTVYSALPGNPFVSGVPWKYNPNWPEHRARLEELNQFYACAYFTRKLPDEYSHIDEADLPEAGPERLELYFDFWFGRKNVPCAEAGVSAAPILQWIWHCLAHRSSEVYYYIMNWLASWRQMITDAPDTCLVLRSECGTGKTAFVSMLGALVGSEYYHAANDAEDVLGYFTEDLSQLRLLFLDEVKITNEKEFSKLKQLLTATSARVRRMNTNAKQMPKYFAVFMAGNPHQLLPADPGERRFVFLELPSTLSNCKNYLCKLLFDFLFCF